MTKGGNGSHWEGCEESHHDCAIAKLRAAEKRIKDLEFVSYEYTCRDGHTETETFETEEVGDAYAEMRFRKEVAEYEIEKLRAEKGMEVFQCPNCGAPWQARDGKCIHCWVNEATNLRKALEGEVEELKRILNPPPPPPDAVHASAFGSAGAGLVEAAWEKWTKRRLVALEDVLE